SPVHPVGVVPQSFGSPLRQLVVYGSHQPQVLLQGVGTDPVADDDDLTHCLARILLLRASWVTSARPSSSRRGGMYMPKRPRWPFRSPYQPPTGLSGERPHASIVPSAAGFCSSVAPNGTQSPRSLSHACRSSIARSW